MALFSNKPKPGERGAGQHAPSAAKPASNQDKTVSTNIPKTFSRSSEKQQEELNTGGEGMANIGKSITIKGELSGDEDLIIEGKLDGRVELPNNLLTVGSGGDIHAEINAKGVIVVGRVSGNVNGTERVEIQATGIVEGDVCSPKLVVHEGAVVNGIITMGKKALEKNQATTPNVQQTQPLKKAAS